MGNITSSHDQLRFIGIADGQVFFSDNGTERTFSNPPSAVKHKSSYSKLANFHAFNISIPGIPVVYYGEEIGLMGSGDPGNRRPMRFGADISQNERKLFAEISQLNKLRSKYPSLALGDLGCDK
jgi:glycosidase